MRIRRRNEFKIESVTIHSPVICETLILSDLCSSNIKTLYYVVIGFEGSEEART